MKLFVALTTLCAAHLLCGAGAASTYKQSAKAAMDFISHEQSHSAAEAATPSPTPAPARLPTTPSSSFRQQSSGDTQQRVQPQPPRQNASGTPKKDWELVPPRQVPVTTPAYVRPTSPSYRPTPPTYAGVVKDHRQQDRGPVALPTLPATTSRPRVYNIPIVVEDRANYTTTTEQSRWYDKLFGKGTDVDDDSPWGRRRRQVQEQPRGAERSEVVIGSNAIRVMGSRPQTGSAQPRPRPGQ